MIPKIVQISRVIYPIRGLCILKSCAVCITEITEAVHHANAISTARRSISSCETACIVIVSAAVVIVVSFAERSFNFDNLVPQLIKLTPQYSLDGLRGVEYDKAETSREFPSMIIHQYSINNSAKMGKEALELLGCYVGWQTADKNLVRYINGLILVAVNVVVCTTTVLRLSLDRPMIGEFMVLGCRWICIKLEKHNGNVSI